MYSENPDHKYLANNTKGRSLADPWVIAHAMSEGATVVTKEYLSGSQNPQKIKIPDVCNNMKVDWIDDFEFIRQLNLLFECKMPSA